MNSELLYLERKINSISIILDDSILNDFKKILNFYKTYESLKELEKDILEKRNEKENFQKIYEKVLSIYKSHKTFPSSVEREILNIKNIYPIILQQFFEIENVKKFYDYVSNFCKITKRIFRLRENFYSLKLKEIEREVDERKRNIENLSFSNLVETGSKIKVHIEILNKNFDIENYKILLSLLEDIEIIAKEKNDKELYEKTKNVKSFLRSFDGKINEKFMKRLTTSLNEYKSFLKKIINEYLKNERKFLSRNQLFEEEYFTYRNDVEKVGILVEKFRLINKPWGTYGLIRDLLEEVIEITDKIGERDLAKTAAELYKMVREIREETLLSDFSVAKVRKFTERFFSKLDERYRKLKSYIQFSGK